MPNLDIDQVTEYVNQNIDTFHHSRLASLQRLKLKAILERKNPYLFKAKAISSAAELVNLLLDAYLSSSEEGLFGQFLEALAIFVNQLAYNTGVIAVSTERCAKIFVQQSVYCASLGTSATCRPF